MPGNFTTKPPCPQTTSIENFYYKVLLYKNPYQIKKNNFRVSILFEVIHTDIYLLSNTFNKYLLHST